jgi:hypothetical protein
VHKINALQHGNTKPDSGNIMGTITRSRGAYRAFGATRALKIQWLAKAVDYGMEEVIGSIPIRFTN